MKRVKKQVILVLMSAVLLFLGGILSIHTLSLVDTTDARFAEVYAVAEHTRKPALLPIHDGNRQDNLEREFPVQKPFDNGVSGVEEDLKIGARAARTNTDTGVSVSVMRLQVNDSLGYIKDLYRDVTVQNNKSSHDVYKSKISNETMKDVLSKGESEFNKSQHADPINDWHVYPIRDPNSIVLEADTNLTTGESEGGVETVNDQSLQDANFKYRKSVFEKYYSPIESKSLINCDKIVTGDKKAVILGRAYSKRFPREGISPFQYVSMSNCDRFKSGRRYIDDPLSETEINFPLAFGIMAYRDVEQVERLLRAIYRPHNFYCIHFDAQGKAEDRAALKAIASCFDNVLLAPDAIDVHWAEFSVLEMELVCLRHLWKQPGWKYYINLTGQEFPLKTNLEVVTVLKAMKGANLVDGTEISISGEEKMNQGYPPPHNILPIKGSVHVALNRKFVHFCLHHNRSRDFLEWLKDTKIPDETFFASLNHNPHLGIPGTFAGQPGTRQLKPFFMRYKVWRTDGPRLCHGKYVRWVCILGVEDISQAFHSVGLFANKFHLNYQYVGYDCLEEVLYKRTWEQYLQGAVIDTTFYSLLDQVRYQLEPSNSSFFKK